MQKEQSELLRKFSHVEVSLSEDQHDQISRKKVHKLELRSLSHHWWKVISMELDQLFEQYGKLRSKHHKGI